MQTTKRVIKRIWLYTCIVFLMQGNYAMAASLPSYGVIQDSYRIPSVEISAEVVSGKRATALPASYDSRDNNWITAVKNQDNTQICWAFAVMSCAETNALRMAMEEAPDYSEMHLSYFFGRPVYDPLNLCGKDSTYFVGDYLYVGGNNRYTTFALANWTGVAKESAYPFIPEFYQENLGSDNARNDVLRLQNAFWIPMNETDYIKEMIMEYGCVASSYYNLEGYFSEDNCSYYNPLYTSTNHAMTIVGWDDAYPKESFQKTPEGDGAWLIKGSWGEDFGDNGYYWISYYDAALSASQTTAFVFDFDSVNKYDHNYFYDGSCGTKTAQIASGKSIANTFTICGNKEGNDESLDAIGFAVAESNVEYSVQIYKDVKDGGKPTSGVKVFSEPVKGQTKAVGYYTIPLEDSVVLRAGQRYSVVVTLSRPGCKYVNYFVDKTYENTGWIGFVNETQIGQSFAQNDDGTWIDLHNENATARVKAYTTDLDVCSPSSFSFVKDVVTIRVEDTFASQLIVMPEKAHALDRNWKSSNPLIASVDGAGVVLAHTIGETLITVEQGGVSSSYMVKVIPRQEDTISPIVQEEPKSTNTENIENIQDNKDNATDNQTKIKKPGTIKLKKAKKKGKELIIYFSKRYATYQGYDILTASDKKIKKNKKSKSVKNSGKVIKIKMPVRAKYVMVRAWRKDINGKKIKGKWSKVYKIR